jgi:lysozyme family protein
MSDAFEAGFRFFMGPLFDGHENDNAPGEHFETRFGVTEMTYRKALKEGIVTKPFDQCHSPDDMKPIYRHDYYDADRCGEMPSCVAMVCFVDATLMGNRTPAKNLQTALGLAPDGVIGSETLAALKSADAKAIAAQLEAADLAYLRALPNWGLFKNGWTNRETRLLQAAIALA